MRRGEVVIAHSSINPAPKNMVGNVGFSRELRKSNSAPIRGVNDSVSGRVVTLLYCGFPAAIRWLVVFISVNSTKRVFLARSAPHISKKGFVAVPTLANLYAATAIKAIFPSGFAIAAAAHAKPRKIFLGFFVALSVSSLGLATFLNPEAATTFGVADRERTAVNNCFLSAITNAVPPNESSTCGMGRLRNDHKTPESFAGSINFFHRIIITDMQRSFLWGLGV